MLVLAALSLPDSLERRIAGGAKEIVAPIQSGLSVFASRLKEAVSVIRGLGGMATRNLEMRQELTRLRNEVRLARGLAEQNRRLRLALELKQAHSDELIPCEVIARAASGWWRTVRVAKESEAPIALQSTAITANGLAGKVVAVSRNTADVLLVSDPTCRVSVRIDRLGVSGVLFGRRELIKGRALCRMNFINKDADVRVGDEVATSGLGGVFPKGLLVGRVSQVYQGPSGLYQYADIVPSVDLGNLDILFLIAPQNPLAEPSRAGEGGV